MVLINSKIRNYDTFGLTFSLNLHELALKQKWWFSNYKFGIFDPLYILVELTTKPTACVDTINYRNGYVHLHMIVLQCYVVLCCIMSLRTNTSSCGTLENTIFMSSLVWEVSGIALHLTYNQLILSNSDIYDVLVDKVRKELCLNRCSREFVLNAHELDVFIRSIIRF